MSHQTLTTTFNAASADKSEIRQLEKKYEGAEERNRKGDWLEIEERPPEVVPGE
jgi:hypothetical protein